MGNYYTYCSAVDDLRLSKSTYAVYHVLASYANNLTRESYPSKSTIAAKLGISTRTVQRATQELVKVGLLRIKARYNSRDRKQMSNLYTLLDNPQTQMPVNNQTPATVTMKSGSRSFPATSAGSAMRVFYFLKSRMGKEGCCSARLHEIAHYLHCSKRTVQRSIAFLRKCGLLAAEQVKGVKNIYSFAKTRYTASQGIVSPGKLAAQKKGVSAPMQTPHFLPALLRILRLRR